MFFKYPLDAVYLENEWFTHARIHLSRFRAMCEEIYITMSRCTKVVFNYDSVRRLLDDILTNQESQDETDKQERTVGSRFPCGFPGCQASFKYDVRRGRHVSSLMTHVVNPVSWL